MPFVRAPGPASGAAPSGFNSGASYAEIGLCVPKYDLRIVEAARDSGGLGGPVAKPGMRTPIEGRRRRGLNADRVGERLGDGMEP